MADPITLSAREDLGETKRGKAFRKVVLQDASVPGLWGTIMALTETNIVGFVLTPVYAESNGNGSKAPRKK